MLKKAQPVGRVIIISQQAEQEGRENVTEEVLDDLSLEELARLKTIKLQLFNSPQPRVYHIVRKIIQSSGVPILVVSP